MLKFFKKKTLPTPTKQVPIPLPEITGDKMSPVTIAEMLRSNTAIWGWYKATDLKNNQINFTAILNMTIGFDGFALFRREGDYLVKYRVEAVGKELKIYLKISEICRLSNSNIMELFNTELSDAYKLFYDEDSKYAAGCQSYVHDITEEMIENKLSNNRVFLIGEEHFFKISDYPDGLPSEIEK